MKREQCKEEDCMYCKEKCYENSVGMTKRYTKRGIVDEHGLRMEVDYEI